MSDAGDGSGPVPRRTPRSADGGAPVSGALAIVLAVIAVVAGFFILRSISGDEKKQFDLESAGTGAAANEGNNEAETTAPSSLPSTAPASTTTTIVTDGATVVVAGRDAEKGAARVGEIEALGGKATFGPPGSRWATHSTHPTQPATSTRR